MNSGCCTMWCMYGLGFPNRTWNLKQFITNSNTTYYFLPQWLTTYPCQITQHEVPFVFLLNYKQFQTYVRVTDNAGIATAFLTKLPFKYNVVNTRWPLVNFPIGTTVGTQIVCWTPTTCRRSRREKPGLVSKKSPSFATVRAHVLKLVPFCSRCPLN